MDWTNLLGGGVLGGVTGLFGSAVTAFTSYKMQKMKNEHDLAMAREDRQSLKEEAELAIRKDKVRTEGEIEKAEIGALTESFKSAQQALFDKSYMEGQPGWLRTLVAVMFAIVDFVKGMARPTLTYYFVVLATWVAAITYRAEPKKFVAQTELIVSAIIYLTVTCVTWWFCDRRMAKFLMRLSDGNLKK